MDSAEVAGGHWSREERTNAHQRLWGPEPTLKLLIAYDKESQMGHFFLPVSSDQVEPQRLIRHGQMAARQLIRMPMFGKVDASRPIFREAHPNVQYFDSIRTPKDAASTDIFGFWGKLLIALNPQR